MIIDSNRLLAQFLGFELTDRVVLPEIYKGEESPFSILEFVDMVRESDNLPPSSIQNLKFHTDWNWLMEVVKKIKEFFNGTDPLSDKQISEVIKLRKKLNESFTSVDIHIEYVYNSCVEFIIWHNENK